MTADAIFNSPGPRWFSIAAHRPFVEDLAWGLMRSLQPSGPESLADAVVLTPTRRAGRELQAAFLKHAGDGGALLLPQIRTLGDLDEGEPPFETAALAMDLPPAVGGHRRRFELARLALQHQHLIDRRLDAAQALEMGAALGRLFDSAAIEEATGAFVDLQALADRDHAAHWRKSAAFLQAAADGWRDRLDALGLVDVSARQVALLRLLAEQWRRDPPPSAVIAAGAGGGAPAAADLLSVVAGLPQGAVVLPGLDRTLADAAWAHIDQTEEQHPQSALKRLIAAAGVERGDVQEWPSPESPADARRGRWRRRLINEALRPVEATADWVKAIAKLRADGALESEDAVAEGLAGLAVVTARHEGEAANVAALLLRETLDTPGRTAALVTPDPVFARRVQAALGRFGVVADSSAGTPLTLSAVATLTLLLARAAAADAPDAVGLLAMLKTSLTRLGRDPGDLSRAAATLEKRALRGPAVRDWGRLQRRLDDASARAVEDKDEDRRRKVADASALLGDLKAAIDGLRAVFVTGESAVADGARALVVASEILARNESGSLGGLWAGPEGEAAATVVAALLDDGEALPPVTPGGFAELLETLLAAELVRTGEATHGRVRILGLIEARLVRADRMILAGLEEGVWPAAAPLDPFLSRPMRAALGLPPPERRTGQAAHDFAQAACAPEVFLIHAERRGGAPAVKSRWLWRLETLARGAGVDLPGRPELVAWARSLDRPETVRAAERPAPTPPVGVRPKELSVTRVEAWIRDPYSTYAQYILRLGKMARPSEAIEAAARGTAIHAALETFAKSWPEQLPEDCEGALIDAIASALLDAGVGDAAMVRETLLAEGCARWLAEFERTRRANGTRVLVERRGVYAVPVDLEDFTITARADRLEAAPDGTVHVWDYKTGYAPTRKEIDAGLSPQLTLTAAIIAGGGFADAGTLPGELGYIRLTGREPPGECVTRFVTGESADAAETVLDDLARRVRRFRRPEEPYVSWAIPRLLSKFGGDYDQLARVWEWHVVGGDDDEAAA